jgi:hypothetical protein
MTTPAQPAQPAQPVQSPSSSQSQPTSPSQQPGRATLPPRPPGMLPRTANVGFVFVPPPKTPVARVGRKGRDLWVSRDWRDASSITHTFGNRFDDPGGAYGPPIPEAQRFQTLYCATRLAGSVAEVAAGEQPDRDVVAASGASRAKEGDLSPDWCASRAVSYTVLDPSLLFVDVASVGTINELKLSPRLARVAEEVDILRIDRGAILGDKRRFTQEIARIVYELPVYWRVETPGGSPRVGVLAGIRYESRHPEGWECWAVFCDRLACGPITYETLDLMDREVLLAAEDLGLLIKVGPGNRKRDYARPQKLLAKISGATGAIVP